MITTVHDAGPESEPEEVKAYRLGRDYDALRAYHLERVFRQLNTVISAENAEVLARLLGGDNGEDQDVA